MTGDMGTLPEFTIVGKLAQTIPSSKGVKGLLCGDSDLQAAVLCRLDFAANFDSDQNRFSSKRASRLPRAYFSTFVPR
jgi:hypothetical protein